LDKENWKKYRIMSKKVDIWPKLHEIRWLPMTTSKTTYHSIDVIDVSKFPQRMNEQLLTVSAPQNKSCFEEGVWKTRIANSE